ncbi:16S rRNA (guanine(527)-N(7))-methyltransferase RsmG [Saccharomonospora azurea]
MEPEDLESRAPTAVRTVFGEHAESAAEFVAMLASHGVERGLIGPREVDRLWDRHVLNSAVLAELIPEGARVVDVGSGAGFPGIPLAIARPDLDIVLLEPMARRVEWLTEVVETLALSVSVERGRAEEKVVRRRIDVADVVTARAVAPLARLAQWCLPLVKPSGELLALKGQTAADEIERDRSAVRKAGGGDPRIVRCGAAVLETPTTVIAIERVESGAPGVARKRGRKKH